MVPNSTYFHNISCNMFESSNWTSNPSREKQIMSGCNGLNSSYFPFCVVFAILWCKEGSRTAKKTLKNLAEKDQDNFTPSR